MTKAIPGVEWQQICDNVWDKIVQIRRQGYFHRVHGLLAIFEANLECAIWLCLESLTLSICCNNANTRLQLQIQVHIHKYTNTTCGKCVWDHWPSPYVATMRTQQCSSYCCMIIIILIIDPFILLLRWYDPYHHIVDKADYSCLCILNKEGTDPGWAGLGAISQKEPNVFKRADWPTHLWHCG